MTICLLLLKRQYFSLKTVLLITFIDCPFLLLFSYSTFYLLVYLQPADRFSITLCLTQPRENTDNLFWHFIKRTLKFRIATVGNLRSFEMALKKII